MNISSNISSMQAHQSMMNTSANNVANVNTDGFVPKDTKMSGGQNSVEANLRTSNNNGSTKSQTDLAKEVTDQIIASRATETNVSAIRTKDEMLGSLLDMKA